MMSTCVETCLILHYLSEEGVADDVAVLRLCRNLTANILQTVKQVLIASAVCNGPWPGHC